MGVRVLLVDDQILMRSGLRKLLEIEDGVEIVADVGSGPDALTVVPLCRPDVALVDARMPGMDGIELITELARSHPDIASIVLTTFDEDEYLFGALKAGARGFLLKDVSLEQLAAAIRAVAQGRTILQPSITETLLRNLQTRQSATYDDDLDELSEREGDVIRLMAGGFSNREIGEMLGLSTGTVKNHVSRLLLKLDARDRTSAVLKAIASRLA